MPGTPHFLASEFDQASPEHAAFHVIPVPYEATVSYGGGTAGGPAAILEASTQLEVFDGESIPGEAGFFTQAPVDCSGDRAEVYKRIRQAVLEALGARRADGAGSRSGRAGTEGLPIPVVLGGEHSITLPVMEAFVEVYGAKRLGIVQFDAHADLRNEYSGSPYSHACVMRRIHADLGIRLCQLGIRAVCPEEIIYRQEQGIFGLDASDLVPKGSSEITLPADFPELVFISFDVDGLDPSIMPATGTPVPGGIGWYQALGLLRSVARQRQIVGFDLVELAPLEGLHAPTYLAAELVHKIMGFVSRSAHFAGGGLA